METTAAKRIHAESTFNALAVGRLDLNNREDATETAERCGVPEALVWLAVDGVDIEKIDELVMWWPRKEGA
jgi:hypothetical protein